MGNELTHAAGPHIGALPPWLDSVTSALVEDMIHALSAERPDMLAVVLFGSIARHEERPTDDPSPSDVDVLLIFETEDERFALREEKALFRLLGSAFDRHLEAPRDVKVMFASRTLGEWDPTFIANVARDGRLLWACGPLPPPLAAVGSR